MPRFRHPPEIGYFFNFSADFSSKMQKNNYFSRFFEVYIFPIKNNPAAAITSTIRTVG